MNTIGAVVHRQPEVNVCVVENDKIISSFDIYPKSTNHNQDGNHSDNKVWLTNFFFEMTN
jgi:hypothetical protein